MLSRLTLSWIGWVATACFGLSYFFRKQSALRLIQAGAALLWIVYGLLIHAMPVVAANAIVALAALYSTFIGNSASETFAGKSQAEQGTT
jgi:hypothetical protein